MERTPEIFEKIEAYLANTLLQEELEAFKKEIAADPKLQLEIEKHKSLHQTLSDQDTIAFKEKLKRISDQIKKEETTNSLFSPFWKIAASIILLFGVGTLLWYTLGHQNYAQDLYAQYYKPFPVEDLSRGETSNEFQDIMIAYTKGDYNTVIATLEKHPDIHKNEQLQLYLGNSYLHTRQEEKAIIQFKNIQKNSPYYENGEWYLALTYLKLGNTKKSKPILEEIVQYNGIYKDSASKLIKAIDR